MRRSKQGFTLIELMVVVVIVAIFAAIAIPSYQAYIQRASAAQAQQEIQKLAEQLERHKGRNFSYKGFDASYLYKDNTGAVSSSFDIKTQTLTLPLNGSSAKYVITIVDFEPGNRPLNSKNVLGQNWAIKAASQGSKNYTFLMTSQGERCKNMSAALVGYMNCGSTGGEGW